MKKLMNLICTGMLVAALVMACDKQPLEIIEPDPDANCWVFVRTTPGQETILLAKSGLTHDEASAIFDGLKSQYGNENVKASVGYAAWINDGGKDYIAANPDAVTSCYEVTMTIEFEESSVPSVEDLISYGFIGVKINGRSAICKEYYWAFTEEVAKRYIQWCEGSYNSEYGRGLPAKSGTIVGSTTIKNLGPEVHDEPIIF